MRRNILLLVFALVAAMSCAFGAKAYDFYTGGLYYNITGSNTVEVTYKDTNYGSYSGYVKIPGSVTYNGTSYTVTAVGNNAFLWCFNLTEVSIPKTVTTIKESAFQETALTRIIIPNSVKVIEPYSFGNCFSLTDIILGNGITTIGGWAFSFFGETSGATPSTPTQVVVCLASTPPECVVENGYGDEPLDFFYTYGDLYVPSGTGTYANTEGWNNFSNIQSESLYYSKSIVENGSYGTISFNNVGNYAWFINNSGSDSYAQSGNAGATSSTSTLASTINVQEDAILSFDFKAWGEGTSYDKCIFTVDGEQKFSYGARDNEWESYAIELSAGTHTVTWSYQKDGSVDGTGDYFAIDHVRVRKSGPETYACFTSSDSTLTFYYDDQRSNRPGTTYDLNTGTVRPGWNNISASISQAVFDSTFTDARPTTTYMWFSGMTNLKSVTGMKEYLNTSQVTNMNLMFRECSKLTTLDVSGFKTSNVTSMNQMFYDCSGLTSLSLDNFNTANVTDMSWMFFNCKGLTNLNLYYFNTANVTDMSAMFHGCSGLTSLDVSRFNTANVTTMENMFFNCRSLGSLVLTSFNTANVTNLRYMFYNCVTLSSSLNLKSFNTAKVTDMEYMFYNCYRLVTIYVGSQWSTAAVTRSSSMFSNCTRLVGGKGTTYDTSHLGAEYAHIDGGTANPGYFTEWREAYVCRTTSQINFYYDDQRSNREGMTYSLSGTGWTSGNNEAIMHVIFDPSFADFRPTTTANWFNGLTGLKYISGLQYLNTSEVKDMSGMFKKCHLMGGCPDLSTFNTEKVTSMAGMFDNFWGNNDILDLSSFNTANVTDMAYMFSNSYLVGNLDLSSFNTANVTDMTCMFYNDSTITAITVGEGWNTDAVTSSSNMFYNCTGLVGGRGTTYDANHVDAAYAHIDGGSSNPGYLTSIHPAEAYACYTPSNTTLTFYYDDQRGSREGTTYDLNTGSYYPGWYSHGTYSSVTSVRFDASFADARPVSTNGWFMNMSNLTTITGMKEYLNTEAVTDMGFMFYSCTALASLDLSGFNTSKVTYMDCMFYNCTGLKSLDVSSFNTSNVTYMSNMFEACYMLGRLDLSSFNTANVIDMSKMFHNSNKLTTIYVGGDWSTASVAISDNMFNNCTALVGGQGTIYDANHIDAAYAHIDGGPSNPGYFTAKEDILRGDVDGDGNVGISDVTALIDYLLTGDAANIVVEAADVDGDGNVGIADVTALIDYILTGHWNDEQNDDHEWVDLGLPSGTLWATCNVGASSPEEYGDYFAWGEVDPNLKDVYDLSTYKWCNGTETSFTKYCTNSSYGTVDNKKELDPEDDAAVVNWGEDWRMPSVEQLDELMTKCTWTWTTMNGVYGGLVTGPNGNTLFLPAAGSRFDSSHYDAGSFGFYWSRSLYQVFPHSAFSVTYDSSEYVAVLHLNRTCGVPVRPVRVHINGRTSP